MIKLTINGEQRELDADPSTPLLWAIRDLVGLTGTKYGCGIAQCGACTVHIDGKAQRACITPIATVAGKQITTIEGLSTSAGKAVQKAWEEISVPQCGYCQSGQIMSAASLLVENSKPTDEEITNTMRGNICRCCTYQRIRKAVKQAAVDLA